MVYNSDLKISLLHSIPIYFLYTESKKLSHQVQKSATKCKLMRKSSAEY